jgi:hypothetical protein
MRQAEARSRAEARERSMGVMAERVGAKLAVGAVPGFKPPRGGWVQAGAVAVAGGAV